MIDLTVFRVHLDDETVEAVLTQAQAVKRPPREIIAAVVRDVFLEMKRMGVTMQIAPPNPPQSDSRH